MESPSVNFRSSINSVIDNLPQGHDKAFKQAIYTTAANIFVILAGAAAIAVYFILEPFLGPLLWSVLCGTFLYPFKRSLTNSLKKWLSGLRNSGTLFVVGIVTLPFSSANRAYESVYCKIVNHLNVLGGGLLVVFSSYLLWHFGPVYAIFGALQSMLYFVYEALGYFTSFWVWTIVVAYLLAVGFLWSPESKRYLRYLSMPVWFVLILHTATVAGSLRVPLFILLLIVIMVGFVAEVREVRKPRQIEGKLVTPSPVETAWIVITGDYDSLNTEKQSEELATTSEQNVAGGDSRKTEEKTETELKKPSSLPVKLISTASPQQKYEKKITSKLNVFLKKDLKEIPEPVETKPQTSEVTTKQVPPSKEPDKRKPSVSVETKGSGSDNYFLILFWMLILTRLWMNMWILQLLLPIGFIMWLFKFLGYQLSSEGILGDKVKLLKGKAEEWLKKRKDALAPRWICGLFLLIKRGDAKIIRILELSLDKATSILFILLLLVGTILVTVFCAAQVQQESMHLAQMTSNLFNNTLHPEITSWLPDGEEMQKAMDSMVGNAYLYGRNWIASKVRDLVDGEKATSNNTQLENQVLEVWDNLYENWLARNASSNTQQMTTEFQVIPADFMNLQSLWEFVTNGDRFNLGQVIPFVKENIGTFMSVLESIWLVLKGNMNLVFNLLTATLSLVFGGGTAILNFVLSSAIFLTTLFYLLASSGDQYKPVEWFSSISVTHQGNSFGQAVQEAVGGVFMASLKMAVFYGLYTWLTHSVFGVNIVFIPSALAAVFAAVPFLGTYWAAIPAVLELWLVKGQGVLSILLFVLHMLPTYVVDTTILSEIKGGHPYITGLAIAGGIFWLGLEGAIIGPILLCCLIVAINVYSNMLQPDTPTAGYNTQEPRVHRVSLPSLFQRSVSSTDVTRR
ncbi:transmembrane protein 245-like isoform X1 [Mytilus californianus]|uniref:transmembrane protein 245-like isoform X1 n=1 Tax=Mytilus californianus TaxID=6549 RepID=UPI0022477BD8|nr:transmembrane protein 245-like isoform X1 [Mytilus californianus]